jgi:hypothetical protein
VMIGQLQDVGFVFVNILIGRGDAQIADDAGGWRSAFLGHCSTIRLKPKNRLYFIIMIILISSYYI